MRNVLSDALDELPLHLELHSRNSRNKNGQL